MLTDQQHPITPPPELVMQWVSLACEYEGNETWIDLATQAARWGADTELNECCHLLRQQGFDVIEDLRAARRPKPPSLAEEALNTLGKKLVRFADPEGYDTIRRAAELLQELEKGNE